MLVKMGELPGRLESTPGTQGVGGSGRQRTFPPGNRNRKGEPEGFYRCFLSALVLGL